MIKNLIALLSSNDRELLCKFNALGDIEGWGIYECQCADMDGNDEWRLERHDEMEIFTDDVEAIKYVTQNHPEVIEFFNRNGSKQELEVIAKVNRSITKVYNSSNPADMEQAVKDLENILKS